MTLQEQPAAVRTSMSPAEAWNPAMSASRCCTRHRTDCDEPTVLAANILHFTLQFAPFCCAKSSARAIKLDDVLMRQNTSTCPSYQ